LTRLGHADYVLTVTGVERVLEALRQTSGLGGIISAVKSFWA
jgi:hypothetical protein